MLRWNEQGGFGFIKPDDGGEDLFCRVSNLVDGDGSVRSGDTVTFGVEYNDRKGKDQACKVKCSGGGGGRRGGGDRGRRGRSDSRDRGRRRDRSRSRSRSRRRR